MLVITYVCKLAYDHMCHCLCSKIHFIRNYQYSSKHYIYGINRQFRIATLTFIHYPFIAASCKIGFYGRHCTDACMCGPKGCTQDGVCVEPPKVENLETARPAAFELQRSGISS